MVQFLLSLFSQLALVWWVFVDASDFPLWFAVPMVYVFGSAFLSSLASGFVFAFCILFLIAFSILTLARRFPKIVRAILASLGLGGCAIGGASNDLGADWSPVSGGVADMAAELGGADAPRPSIEIASGGRSSVGGTLGGPALPPIEEPIDLVFADITGAQVMRRLSEATSLEFVGETTTLDGVKMSVDVSLRSAADLYDLVDTVAGMAGVNAIWTGRRVLFEARKDGATISPDDGVFVVGAGFTPELITLAQDRFDVSCSSVNRIAVCVGDVRAIEKVQRLASLLADERNAFSWSVLSSNEDLKAIADAIGVGEQVLVSSLGGSRWLIVSKDERLRDAMAAIAQAVDDTGCRLSMFAPQFLSPAALADALVKVGRGFCAEPVVSDDFVMWTAPGRVSEEVRAVAAAVDREKFIARLVVGIRSASGSIDFGAKSVGASLTYPGFSLGDAVEFSAMIARQKGWRLLDLWFDGQGDAAIQQTDRVQGSLLVTDGGAQVQSIENRTVGLSITADGALGLGGFRGQLTVDDSFLDGQTTLRANCAAFIRVQLGRVVEVCRYYRNQKGLTVALDRVSARKGKETYEVFAGLLPAEDADLVAVRAALGIAR